MMRLHPEPSQSSGRSTRFRQRRCGVAHLRGTLPPLARAAPTPRADKDSKRQRAATFYLAFRLCPSLSPGVGGPAALLHQQPARRRTRQWPQAGRVRGKTPARWTAARSAVPNAEDWHPYCTRDDTAKTCKTTRLIARQEARQRAVNWRPSWACLHPDRMRNADRGGCTDWPEIPAVERCRIGHAQQEQLARFEAAAKLQGWQRSAQPVGRQRNGHWHAVDAYLSAEDADMLRRDRAHTLEQRNASRQVAALRSERSYIWRQ